MTIHIGVIADTHFPTRMPSLPYDRIREAFAGVLLILHAGDIETPDVLAALGRIAPVEAVAGDDDRFGLPRRRVLEVESVRIGLHHGMRPWWMEARSRIANVFGKRGFQWGGIQNYLLRQFRRDAVGAIVFGHFHVPYNAIHGGVLIFNPGGLYTLTPESARWQLGKPQPGLRRAMLEAVAAGRLRGDVMRQPTLGRLTVSGGKIEGQVIVLPQTEHPG